MELLLPFLHLIFIILIITSSSSYLQPVTPSTKHENSTDLEALLSFRAHADPHGILASNWTYNSSFCSWVGVRCSRRRQRVTAIKLANLTLQGTISPHLGNLSFLSDLILSNNALTGPIPESIGYLRRLTRIVLQHNSLTGPIPSTIFNMSSLISLHVGFNNLSGSLPSNNNSFPMPPRLREIALSANRFTGDVLPSFLQCRDIQLISLSQNLFSGSIPAEIGTLSKLNGLYLRDNQLIGTIPSSLGNLTELTKLELAWNKLSGIIPEELGNLTSLQFLGLSSNSLTGPIPESIGYLPHLTDILLLRNSLTGPIPSSIFNMSSLLNLYVNDNNLSGSLPSNNNSFPLLPRLRQISLGFNRFTGDVLPIFLQCRDIQAISLSRNSFSGSIPAEIDTLSKLSILYLGGNQLTGTIPSSLGNLTELTELELGLNKLSGIIPEELGNLVNLQSLDLNENGNIVGSIPTSLLNLPMLKSFSLAENMLTGSVPSGIGNSLPMLEWFDVGDNKLSGGLEFLSSLSNCKNLKYLQIQNNALEGVLSDDVGNLSINLQFFVAGDNRIKGNIPNTLGNLSGLMALELGNNELIGTIPSTLSKIELLNHMSLQVNSLSGLVPSELGLMKNLNVLLLGYNKLFGSVPESLANISMLQKLYLDNNKLSGSIPKSLWTMASLLQLDLSRNNLSGILPSKVSDLIVLTHLNLSMNLLSGDIADNLGKLSMLTYLDLSKNSFRGQIPESFGGLISVISINLSSNYLTGSIPKSVATLRYLNSLDLSFNKLEGKIPTGRVFSNFSIPSLSGNKALCGAPQLHISPCDDPVSNDSKRKSLPLKYILLATMLCVALLAIFCLIYAFYSRRKLKSLPNINLPHLDSYRVISHHELVRATGNFSEANLIGSGGFGSVFRGCLDDGLVVAIKVLNLDVEGSTKSFEAECQVLKMVRHKNLIKIISVCSNLDFKALILEYMPNGSLERWLYFDNYFLNLIQRLNIMVDVSLALEYLHHHHPHVVLHCDMKPTNILLDEELLARVSDFGIAKQPFGDSRSTTTASMPGTIGYIAPEYATTGTVSRMGDVYSFGILLLETFTGKKPVDSMFGEQSSLREWISKANTIMDVVDTNILKYHGTENDLQKLLRCLSSIIELGMVCSKYSPKERIPMTDVTVRLQKIKIEYLSS